MLKQPDLLHEAYEHYQATGDRHFKVIPKNKDYFWNALKSIPGLMEKGYICNVSDNLANADHFSLEPAENMSFDISDSGICFKESGRET